MLINYIKSNYIKMCSFFKTKISIKLSNYSIRNVTLDKIYLNYLSFENEEFGSTVSALFFYCSSLFLIFLSTYFFRNNELVLGSIIRLIALLFLIIYVIMHIQFKVEFYKKNVPFRFSEPAFQQVFFHFLLFQTIVKLLLLILIVFFMCVTLDETTQVIKELEALTIKFNVYKSLL